MRQLRTEEMIRKWQNLVEKQRVSGKTAADWCREQHISYETFIIRRSYLKKIQAQTQEVKKTDFIELEEKSTTRFAGIEIHVRGRMLTLCKDFDGGALLKCLQVLERD